MPMKLWTFAVLATVTGSASAQLRLPAPLSALPLQAPLLQSVVPGEPINPRNLDSLSGVRRAAIDKLIRANRHVIEADSNGEPIVTGEILAYSPSEAVIARITAAGFTVTREHVATPPDMRLVVLRAPAGTSTASALKALRRLDPEGVYDYNHIYTQTGIPESLSAPPTQPVLASEATERPHIRVGLVDSGVETSHPIFRDTSVHAWGCKDESVPALHGTAVASLLVTRASADLYAADVYCGSPTGGAVDVIVDALLWMTTQRVPVINVSLVGPRNVLLEHVVAGLVTHGYIVVAAVGNDGPTAPPLYPAAYEHVVGVTGVDAKHQVLLEALRGPQVTFAAPGADIKAANLQRTFSDVRGTSFAAPTVAALLAESLTAPDPIGALRAIDTLAATAIDLGKPGKDLTYGLGLVGTQPLQKK